MHVDKTWMAVASVFDSFYPKLNNPKLGRRPEVVFARGVPEWGLSDQDSWGTEEEFVVGWWKAVKRCKWGWKRSGRRSGKGVKEVRNCSGDKGGCGVACLIFILCISTSKSISYDRYILTKTPSLTTTDFGCAPLRTVTN